GGLFGGFGGGIAVDLRCGVSVSDIRTLQEQRDPHLMTVHLIVDGEWKMALLPPFFLDAVVAIGVGDDPTKRSWIGTGFLYGKLTPKSNANSKSYYVFLITNKHVETSDQRPLILAA